MAAYKREHRKNSKKLSERKDLDGTCGTNKPVEEQDGDYVWLIIRVQACVGDMVFLMSADDLVYKYT